MCVYVISFLQNIQIILELNDRDYSNDNISNKKKLDYLSFIHLIYMTTSDERIKLLILSCNNVKI